MTDLADFLLARIAEENMLAFLAQQDSDMFGSVLDKLGDRPEDDHRITHLKRHAPHITLLETDVKKQVVEDLKDVLANQHDADPTVRQLAERTLRLLASPFAAHRDYPVE